MRSPGSPAVAAALVLLAGLGESAGAAEIPHLDKRGTECRRRGRAL
jgi:hypothetical protein